MIYRWEIIMITKGKETTVFFRLVKAPKGHPFAGLYAVEQVYIKAGAIVDKTIVHEWDLRIISESCLAKMGGSSAFDAYKYDNGDPEDVTGITSSPEAKARTVADLKDLTARKLSSELKGKEPKI
jgi:hypothetical protein